MSVRSDSQVRGAAVFCLTEYRERQRDSKRCEHCGAEYFRSARQGDAVWSMRRYCSARCSARAGWLRTAQRVREDSGCYNCVVCNKLLEGGQQKFCSHACANSRNLGGEQPPIKGRMMTYEQIADELGLTPEQVRNAEASAFRKLARNPKARKLMKLWMAS